MKVVFYDHIPEFVMLPKWTRGKIMTALQEFIAKPDRTMEITWEKGDQYKSVSTMRASYHKALQRVDKKGWKIMIRQLENTIYIIKFEKAKEDEPSS